MAKRKRGVKKAETELKELGGKEEAAGTESSLIKALVSTCIFFGAVLSLVRTNYETNDDLAMVTILSGQGGLFPSHYDSIFLHPVTGYILYKLYLLNTSFPWYGVLVYASLFLGTLLVLFVFIRYNRKASIYLCIPALLFLFQMLTFVSITSASLLLLFGVALCIVAWLVEGEVPIRNRRMFIALLIECFTLATLLRWELVFSFLVFCFPIILFIRKEHLRKVAACSIYVIVLFALAAGAQHLARSQDGKDYIAYNRLRAQFQDTYKGNFYEGVTPHALSRAGWSVDEYVTFRYLFFIYDSQKFNIRSLKAFLSSNKPEMNPVSIQSVMTDFSNNFKMSMKYSAILACVAATLLLYRYRYVLLEKRGSRIRRIISVSGVFIGIVFFLFYRFPFRIFLPLYIFFIGICYLMVNCGLPNGKPVKQTTRYTLISLLALLSAYCTLSLSEMLVAWLIEYEQDHAGFVHEVRRINGTANAKAIYLIPLVPLRDYDYLASANPFVEFNGIGVRIIPTGWIINTPYYNNILKSLGIENGHEFLRWTVDRNGCYFYHVPGRPTDVALDQIKSYILSAVGGSSGVGFKEVAPPSTKGGFILYSLGSLSGPGK